MILPSLFTLNTNENRQTFAPYDVEELVVDERDHAEIWIVQLLSVLEDFRALDGLVRREAVEILVMVRSDQN